MKDIKLKLFQDLVLKIKIKVSLLRFAKQNNQYPCLESGKISRG